VHGGDALVAAVDVADVAQRDDLFGDAVQLVAERVLQGDGAAEAEQLVVDLEDLLARRVLDSEVVGGTDGLWSWLPMCWYSGWP
jgi:hypothetical protein